MFSAPAFFIMDLKQEYTSFENVRNADGQGKRGYVKNMFNSVSPTYDRLNRLLSFGIDGFWRRRIVERAVAVKPQQILDICCGTGDIALLLVDQWPSAVVRGLDFSSGMLTLARRKDTNRRVSWLEADAQDLPFEENSLDLVVHGLRFAQYGGFSLLF